MWAWKFEKCLNCGTRGKEGKSIHRGKGLCHSCWDKNRDKFTQRKDIKKKAYNKWWSKVKGTIEHKEYTRARVYVWQKDNPNLHKKNYTKRNLRLRFKKFIEGNLRVDKNSKDGLVYVCEFCRKRVTTPIAKGKENMKVMIRELEIFQGIHNRMIH